MSPKHHLDESVQRQIIDRLKTYHQDASPLLRLVEEEEKWEAPDHFPGVRLQNWGGTEPKLTVTCMVIKVTDNDRRTSSLSRAEFCGSQSDNVRQYNFKIEVVEMLKDMNWAFLNENPSWVPGAPRKAAVANFKLLTGHDCLRYLLYRLISPTHSTVLCVTVVGL
ncbi:hypothetical protein TNCV_301131 [Trichonephila clavipes]|nr:hypothetical protein TNCV_301131 [Trichonephila clavipes]